MITIYLLEFLVFSFLGWILDSGYRSLTERKWINAGYFKGPFCPIYGFGGLALLFVFTYLDFISLPLLFILGGVSLVLVEYLGGVFAENILHLKLWDYSSSKYHLRGHIDLLHSFYWFFLSILFYYALLAPFRTLEKFILVPEFVELPLLIIFVGGAVWLTVRKNQAQFLDIKGKVMNITVERYQELFSNIQQMYQTTSLPSKKRLYAVIQQQLRHTGAYLKKIKP